MACAGRWPGQFLLQRQAAAGADTAAPGRSNIASRRNQSMNATDEKKPRSIVARPLVALSLLGGSLLLAACAGTPRIAGIHEPENPVSERLGAAEMPSYGKGDKFVFAGGRTEKVLAVSGDKVRWQREDGRELLRVRDFVRPPLAWETQNRRGDQSIKNGPGALWPLAIGKVDTFRARRSMTSKASGEVSARNRDYDCSVETAETVAVPAGTFDTFRVTCRRYSGSGKRLVETRTWNYAPEVGHYVRREIKKRGSSERQVIELQSYRRTGA